MERLTLLDFGPELGGNVEDLSENMVCCPTHSLLRTSKLEILVRNILYSAGPFPLVLDSLSRGHTLTVEHRYAQL